MDGSNQLLNNLTKGEVFEVEGKYFQALQNKNAGDELNSLELSEANIGEQIDGLLALGDTPPQQVDQLSYVPSVIDGTRPDRWFLTKSYQAGDFVKFNDLIHVSLLAFNRSLNIVLFSQIFVVLSPVIKGITIHEIKLCQVFHSQGITAFDQTVK